MSLLTTLAAFLVALSVLIVIHEYGHYWVARRCDVKVLRFSVGFGRALWSRRFGADATELRIALIPLGGYVKMLDEREGPVSEVERHRAFNRKSVWQRSAIVAAGPLANFLAAIAIYWALYMHGVPGLVPQIDTPAAQSAAARAGFVRGETIVAVGGEATPSWQEFRWQLLQRALDGAPVLVESRAEGNGAPQRRELRFDGLTREDIEGDLLRALGFSRLRPVLPPVIGQLAAGGAAARAGLREGDRVEAVGERRIQTWEELVNIVRAAPGEQLQFRVRRGDGSSMAIVVAVDRVQEGQERPVGRIGAGPRVDPEDLQRISVSVAHGPVEAFVRACARTWDTAWFSLRMLGKMLLGEVSLKNLSGPITIADYAGQSAQSGWISYLLFLALISISLGVLNLLPVPLLDGGHLLYYSVEILTGKPLSERVMEIGQQVGMAVLFMLMAFAVYNDIFRLIGS
jgi:regulator of sigma E protease